MYEFAARVGGITGTQVDEVIRIEKQLDTIAPQLHTLLVEGEVSMHKLARVASVITPENESILANQVQLLSCDGLNQLVKDIRDEQKPVQEKFLDVQELELNSELVKKLYLIKQKGIDVSILLTSLLAEYEEKISEDKKDLADEDHNATRYIPQRTKQLLAKEYGTKCAIATCSRLSKNIHHAARYSLSRSHNPNFLAPLCVEHHEIAHSIDVNVQRKKWHM